MISYLIKSKKENPPYELIADQKIIIASLTNEDLIKKSSDKVQFHPIVPNVEEYIRDLDRFGLLGMARKRLRGLSIFNLISISILILRNMPDFLTSMATRIKIMAELELLKYKRKPKRVYLHPQMTDMALAFDYPDMIKQFCSHVQGKSIQPAIMTNNLAEILKRLDDWALSEKIVPVIACPINNLGWMMKPNKKKVERLVRNSKRTIVGFNITCDGTISEQEAIRYAEKQGVNELIITKSI